MRCLALYKSRDVAGTQLGQSEGGAADAILEELADERNAGDYLCLCQAAHLLQVELECLRAPFYRGEPANCSRYIRLSGERSRSSVA